MVRVSSVCQLRKRNNNFPRRSTSVDKQGKQNSLAAKSKKNNPHSVESSRESFEVDSGIGLPLVVAIGVTIFGSD